MGTTCGEVSMAVEAYHHPATGELDGTIRGECAYVCVCVWGGGGGVLLFAFLMGTPNFIK